jgi:hypothetical protein
LTQNGDARAVLRDNSNLAPNALPLNKKDQVLALGLLSSVLSTLLFLDPSDDLIFIED